MHSSDAISQEALFPAQLTRECIVGFIEESFAARGIKRVATGADILIRYGIKVTEQPEFHNLSDEAAPGWGWESGFTTTVQTIYERTLVRLNMVDANQKGLSSKVHRLKPSPQDRRRIPRYWRSTLPSLSFDVRRSLSAIV
jgi:hypothetical protein